MANFATTAHMMDFLQLEIEHEAAAMRALAEATAAVRNYCRQYFELVAGEEITLDCNGGTKLFLPELPVTAVTAVVEDGEALTVDDDYKLGQHGILHRMGGGQWASGIQIIAVTYSHGYANLPEDIVAVTTRAACRAYQAGLRAAEVDGVLGISSKALGDFSVTYASEAGGGVGEGIMGASAARMLLLSEKDILNNYRVKRP